MYLSCPVSFDLEDAEWFDNISDAQDDAIDWSVQLNGEKVIVYEAIDSSNGYTFNPLQSFFA